MKKIMSMLLSVVMLFSITAGLDLSAYADTSSDWNYYVLDDGTALIMGYNGTETDLVIPSTIDGYDVTVIGMEAFLHCQSLTNVTIPDSVTIIQVDAFSDCQSLTSVTIGDSVRIGDDAFSDCRALTSITVSRDNQNYSSQDGVLFDKNKAKLIDYPVGNARKSYTIPDGVTSIYDGAFEYCLNLTNIKIPESVEEIGSSAFFGCQSLTDVTIPERVTDIGSYAFGDCMGLKKIIIDENNPNYSSLDGVLFDKNKTKLIQYPAGTTKATYIFPNSVTSIEMAAFSSCNSLTSITIPERIKSIPNGTFANCINLAKITIPVNVTYIGGNAFYKCTNFKDIFYGGSKENWNEIYIIGYGNECLENATVHYKTCTGHKWDSGKVTKAATCTSTGVKTYICTVCGETKTETIAKKAHSYKNYVTKATTSKNGSIVNKCSICGAKKSTSTIYKIKSVILTTSTGSVFTSTYYNGKVKTPGVTVKDSKGKTLKKGTDYTVSYESGRKNVGRYAVKVTFKGNYSGSQTLYFNIIPKGVTGIKKLTALSKGFTVYWNPQKTQVTGYQIQYSTASNFKNAKTITMPKAVYSAKKVTGRMAKKRYYVRIRTYKTVKFNGKNYNIYSPWCAKKSVVTKK